MMTVVSFFYSPSCLWLCLGVWREGEGKDKEIFHLSFVENEKKMIMINIFSILRVLYSVVKIANYSVAEFGHTTIVL